MSNPKKIILHPFGENGQPLLNVEVYPKTSIDQVDGLQQALDNKQGSLTPEEQAAADSGITREKVEQYDNVANNYFNKNNDYLENIKYDGIAKPIIVPVVPTEFEDNVSYSVRMKDIDIEIPQQEEDDDNNEEPSGDVIDLQPIDNPQTVLNDNQIAISKDGIELCYYELDGLMCLNYYKEHYLDLYYHPSFNKWVDDEGNDYEGEPLTFIVDTNFINDEEILKKILLENHTEYIMEDRTLKQKNEDIKNWKYDEKEVEKVVPPEIENIEYTLPREYNLYNFSLGEINLYKDENVTVSLWEGYDWDLKQNCPAIHINITDLELELDFDPYYGCWTTWNSITHSSTPYSEEISFVVDPTKIIEGREIDFGRVLGLEPQTVTEIITVKLDDKFNEPLKNKLYQVLEIEKEVPNEIEDDKNYYFNRNMNFSNSDIPLVQPLQDEEDIYRDIDNGISITVSLVDDEDFILRFVLTDESANTYRYLVYYNNEWVNEWEDGYPDFYITIFENYIVNKEILQRILNVGTHIEIEYKNQTLEEKNADLQNWLYEDKDAIYDVPKWSEMPSSFYGTIYEDEENQILISVDTELTPFIVRIIDFINKEMYVISNEEQSYGRIYYKENTWYKSSSLKSSLENFEECETPNFVLDKKWITEENYEEIFDTIYGRVKLTLKEKFEGIENNLKSPLKDKVYDKIEAELENGGQYALSDNYDGFFVKYSTHRSGLIYGENQYTPIIDDAQLAYNVSSPQETRDGGAVLEPNFPIFIKQYIISIYLYTDANPYIKRENIKGGDIPYYPDYPVFGASSITVTTDRGDTFEFVRGGKSWEYYDESESRYISVPLNQMPVLMLDKSLIQDEEMLKDFLQLEKVNQTLGQKFDTIEKQLNEPLENWNYDNGKYQPLFEPDGEIVYSLEYKIDDSGSDTILYKSDDLTIVYYYYYGRIYTRNFYWVINNRTYYYDASSNIWEDPNYETISSQEDLPIIDINEKCITSGFENEVKQLLYLLEKPKTLKEKNEDLPNWTYKQTKALVPVEIPNWEAISELQYNEYNVCLVYMSNSAETKPYAIAIIKENDVCGIDIADEVNINNAESYSSVEYMIFNSSDNQYSLDANIWYKVTVNGENEVSTEEVSVDEIPQYNFIQELIVNQNAFNLIYEEKIIDRTTLDEKLNQIETLAFVSEVDTNDWEATVNPIIVSTYPYQAIIQNDNLINSIKCEVEFGLTEMLSENYAPYYECDNETGELTIFDKAIPQSNINIKVIRWIGKIIINS